jgi:hypothetical protein
MVLQDDASGLGRRALLKLKDADVVADFAPVPLCDAAASSPGPRLTTTARRARVSDIRPARCWQDAAMLSGPELILETYEDPRGSRCSASGTANWRSRSMAGAPFDLVDRGGTRRLRHLAKLFDRFVAFDAPVVAAAHEAGSASCITRAAG